MKCIMKMILKAPMMTTMRIKRFFSVAVLMLFALQAFSQDNRFGLWYNADAEIKLVRNLKADLAGSLRTDRNGSNVGSFYLEGGLNYKINKHFSTGAFYRIIENKEDDGNFYFRHRLYAEIKGKMPVLRFTLSARYRFQEQTKTYIKDPEDDEPGFYNRFKFEIDYNVPKLPLTPAVYTEFLGETLASNGILIEKRRTGGSLTYSISKKHDVAVEYIYLTSKVTNPRYFNVISLNYSVKF